MRIRSRQGHKRYPEMSYEKERGWISGAHPPLAYPLHSQIEKYSHSFDKPVLSVVERPRTDPLPQGEGANTALRKHTKRFKVASQQ